MKLKGILLSVYLAAFAFGCAKEPDPVKVAPNGKLMTCESIVHASQTPTYTYKNAPKMESPYSTISESRYAAAPTVTNQICSTPAPAVTSTSSAGTVTIIGHAEYVDKVFSPTTYLGTNLLPIRYAVVEIVERSSGNILATTSTDGAGDYIVTFTYAGGIAYVRILAQLNSRYNGKVLYTDKSQYSVASVAKTISAGEAWTINLCTGADNAGPAFNILDNILNAQIVANSFSTKPTEELVAYWQVGNSSGTSYSKDINSGQHTIQILGTTSDPDEYDDSVLLHEMGHYVAAVYSQDNSDGGPHSFNGHYDLRLAWSEGWASFFQGLIKAENGLPYPEYYLDTDGTTPRTSLEIETPGTTAIEKYKGNGATTNFNTLFKFPDNSNVHVILVDALGVKIPQVENTDYTLSGAGVATGGTVSMVTPPALDEALIIFGIGLFNMPLSISADNELSVAAFLWDVYDAPTTGEAAVNDDDPVNITDSGTVIWNIFETEIPKISLKPSNNEATFESFYDAWTANGRTIEELDPLLTERQINYKIDNYESDDTAETATNTLPCTYSEHTFFPAGDKDWYKIDVTLGTTYRFLTKEMKDCADTLVTLFDSNGSKQLAQNDDYLAYTHPSCDNGSLIEWTADATKTVYLLVEPWRQLSENEKAFDGSYNPPGIVQYGGYTLEVTYK